MLDKIQLKIPANKTSDNSNKEYIDDLFFLQVKSQIKSCHQRTWIKDWEDGIAIIRYNMNLWNFISEPGQIKSDF